MTKKRRFHKKFYENLNYKFRRNSYIKASPVRVVSEDGGLLGVMDTREALNLAREKELDLVEIAPQATPPVCKIIDWSKFKYEYSKKQNLSKPTSSKMKEMRFYPNIAEGDMEHKTKKIREFLDEKSKVRITVKATRTRMRITTQHFFNTINKVLSSLEDVASVETPPKSEGRNVYAIIKPKK